MPSRAAWGGTCATARSPPGLQPGPRAPLPANARGPAARGLRAQGRVEWALGAGVRERSWRGQLALEGTRGHRLSLRPGCSVGSLGRSGAAGARAGQAGEGFPTAKARRPVTSLARPQAWGRESHEIAGIGGAADSSGNFSLSPYFLPLVGTASWPHAREPSGRTGWTVVGPGFSWAADIINSFPPRLGSQTLAGRLGWEGWEH